MSLLSGNQIAVERIKNRITIEPFDPKHLNPNSYNLTLDDYLLKHVGDTMFFNYATQWDRVSFDEPLIPGEFYLARTAEIAGSTVFAPMLEGRSTAARHGITVHLSAGFGDVGFLDRWTLEISVIKRVKLEPGMPICQVSFFEVEGLVDLYRGQYNSGKVVGGQF